MKKTYSLKNRCGIRGGFLLAICGLALNHYVIVCLHKLLHPYLHEVVEPFS